MEKSIEIVKSLLIPKLEKDIFFQRIKFKDAFWETFILSFLNYENDAKPTYELIYALQLNDTERIFDKLPNIYSKLVKELAENYVLGNHDNATDFLNQNSNPTFQKEVRFLETIQKAIKSVERKRIKADLPKAYERLTFEISETDMANVAVKKGREDLKKKMRQWDEDLKPKREPIIFYSIRNENKSVSKPKVISLSWIKYAVAACLIITGGVLYFKFAQTNVNLLAQPDENTVVTSDDKKGSNENHPAEKPIETYAISTINRQIEYPATLGFTNTTAKSITIVFKDATLFIYKLDAQIKNEISSSKNGLGYGARIDAMKKQLYLLKAAKGTYEFDGKQLTVYSKKSGQLISVLSIDDKTFYLKIDTHYYHLYFTKLPLLFTAVTERETIDQLEKISFENE